MTSTHTGPDALRVMGILTPCVLDEICKEDAATEFLVDDILPRRTVVVAGGDSAIGKSPLFYLMGLCVATGRLFAGHKVQQGRVLYFDLENTSHDSREMRDGILKFLGLPEAPSDWMVKLDPPEGADGLEREISAASPDLVVIDTLREFSPEATEKNRTTAELLKKLRSISRKHGCVIVLIHHMRKPKNENSIGAPATLEMLKVVTWLLEMEGPRALVNQSDVRIGIEEGNGNPAALNVKWNRRVHGDSPLVFFERMFDESGVPIGYRHMSGAGLLSTERREAFDKLPSEFSFTAAKDALGRGNDAASRFLRACLEIGVAEKLGRGRYRKLDVDMSSAREADKADFHGK